MNTKSTVAAAALALLCSSAFAGDEFDPARDFPVPQVSAAKPAQVPARGIQQNQYAGDFKSVVTRAQVRAETAAARAQGGTPSFDIGDSYAHVPKTSTLTRDTVRAEARAKARSI